MRIIPCAVCGEDFEAMSSSAKYCPACRIVYGYGDRHGRRYDPPRKQDRKREEMNRRLAEIDAKYELEFGSACGKPREKVCAIRPSQILPTDFSGIGKLKIFKDALKEAANA